MRGRDRLGGGGDSLERTRLQPAKFPVMQGKYREFCGSGRGFTVQWTTKRQRVCGLPWENSLLGGTGNIFRLTGTQIRRSAKFGRRIREEAWTTQTKVRHPLSGPWLFHTVQLEARRARRLCKADFRRGPFLLSDGGAPKERGRSKGHFLGAQFAGSDCGGRRPTTICAAPLSRESQVNGINPTHRGG
jgi:hypothetical protein